MKPLPHSLESEQGIVSAFFRGASIDEAGGLTTSDFYNTPLGIVFGAQNTLDIQRRPVDLPSVVEHLRATGRLDEVGGASAVSRMIDAPAAISVRHTAKTIRSLSMLRNLITECLRSADRALECADDVDALINDTQSRIMAIGADRSLQALESIAAACDGVIDDLEAIQTGKCGNGLTTGFAKIDEVIGGLQPADLIILAARPSMGKTALALNIAENVARIARPVLFFSLEQPKKQLALRSLSRSTGIGVSALRSGRLSPESWGAIIDARATIEKWPLYIDDRSGLHIREIQRIARRQSKDGLGLVVVDYIQLARGDRAERKDLEIGQISGGLKGLAKDLNVPVLALSQLSREVERRNPKRPQLSDLRESGALEQDADVVAFLYNENKYEKKVPEHTQAVEVELLIEKNRQGRTGFFKLLWRAWLTSFSDINGG